MKVFQLGCLLATVAAVIASLSIGAPIWVTTLLIISVVVVQLALEYRRSTLAGAVDDDISAETPKTPADEPANA